MLKYLNKFIVFILELVMFGSFAYYGYQRNTTTLNKYFFAFLLPFVAIILWGLLAAPKASHRLLMPYLALFRAGMLITASFLLYSIEYRKMALLIFIVAIVTQIFSYYSER